MQNMHILSAVMILLPSLLTQFSQLKIFCNTTASHWWQWTRRCVSGCFFYQIASYHYWGISLIATILFLETPADLHMWS
jgi:hypothetical protein